MNDNEKMGWNDIKIPEDSPRIPPPGKGKVKGTGKGFSLPPMKFSPGKIAVYGVMIVLIILAGLLYANVRSLKTDVSLMQDKVNDLQKTNQKLKDDLGDLNKKVEEMKVRKAVLDAAPPPAPKKEEPKPAPKKQVSKPKRDAKPKPR